MGQDRSVAKSRVSMNLNKELVQRARLLTTNLSETVDQLLAGFVDQAAHRDANRQSEIDRHIDASNAFVSEHGTLADEFSTL